MDEEEEGGGEEVVILRKRERGSDISMVFILMDQSIVEGTRGNSWRKKGVVKDCSQMSERTAASAAGSQGTGGLRVVMFLLRGEELDSWKDF